MPETAEKGSQVEGEKKAIAARAGVVSLGTLLSRVLGLGRDVCLSAMFSVAMTDAFWVAFTIPNALRQLLAEGAVQSAVMPVLAQVQRDEGDEGARRFYARLRGLSLTVLSVVSALGVLGAPWLVDLFAGGLADRPEQQARTVALTRILFPYIFFMGSAALGMAALHTARRFVAASFSPALLNVALIACCFGVPGLLAAQGHDPALALAIGALVGGLLQVLAQLPSLRAAGYLGAPRWFGGDENVRLVLRRIGPMTLGLGIYYVDLVVCRRLLSGFGEGAQSYFSWAQRLCDFPQGIFVMALSAATLPSLSTLQAAGDRDGVSKTFAYGMRLSMFVALPVTALFVALSEPIVVAMFMRGEFGALQARETAKALVAQGLGIWAVSGVRQLVPMFFVLGDTRTPVIVSGLDLLALIAIAYGLREPLGHLSVSAGVSGSALVQMLLLVVLLWRRGVALHAREIGVSMLKTLAASALAGVVAAQVASLSLAAGASWLGRMVPAMAGGVMFGVVFVLAGLTVGSDELHALSDGVLKKLRRR